MYPVRLPDTISNWGFYEDLIKAGKVDQLFAIFDDFLSVKCLEPKEATLWVFSSVKVQI